MTAGARVEITGGGAPSPDQLAAIVAALEDLDEGSGEGMTAAPPWLEAALREGVGGPVVTAPSDLAMRSQQPLLEGAP